MYSAARVSQFERKTRFEFLINASQQGNNVKTKLNLRKNLQRFHSSFLWNKLQPTREAATRCVRLELVFLEISQNSQENTFFLIKRFSGILLSCEFCELSKNTFFTEHFRTTASDTRILFSFIKAYSKQITWSVFQK